jgi:arsenate reductase
LTHEWQARCERPVRVRSQRRSLTDGRGLFRHLADPAKARVISAGTAPGTRVHPEVVEVMKEVGIDLSREVPRFLSDEIAASSSLLVTMGCGEACPHVPGLRRLDWALEDPKGKPVERVREIRDEVKRRVQTLLAEERWI